MKKRTQIIIRVGLASTIVALVLVAFWQLSVAAEQATTDRLASERRAINSFLYSADDNFQKSMYFETKEDDSGRPYTVCVLSSELDSFLGELVDAYNADPTTELKVTEADLRLWLTDNILKSMAWDTGEQAFKNFIYWTKAPADLVYRWDVVHGDGTVSKAGEPVKTHDTNYGYLKDKEFSGKDFIYRFEYEANK